MDDEMNLATRHRHGRAWDGPVPLTEQKWDWQAALMWLAVLAFTAVAFAGVWWWARLLIEAARGLIK